MLLTLLSPKLDPTCSCGCRSCIMCGQVPSRLAGPVLASKWNHFDSAGDALRSTKPVEAGILKKCKEHATKLLPTIFYIEFCAYILSQPTPPGHLNLRTEPVGGDDWNLEFVSRIKDMRREELVELDIEYIFDPFQGLPRPRACLVATEVTLLLVQQSYQIFSTFLSPEKAAVAEPAWTALLFRFFCSTHLPRIPITSRNVASPKRVVSQNLKK